MWEAILWVFNSIVGVGGQGPARPWAACAWDRQCPLQGWWLQVIILTTCFWDLAQWSLNGSMAFKVEADATVDFFYTNAAASFAWAWLWQTHLLPFSADHVISLSVQFLLLQALCPEVCRGSGPLLQGVCWSPLEAEWARYAILCMGLQPIASSFKINRRSQIRRFFIDSRSWFSFGLVTRGMSHLPTAGVEWAEEPFTICWALSNNTCSATITMEGRVLHNRGGYHNSGDYQQSLGKADNFPIDSSWHLATT